MSPDPYFTSFLFSGFHAAVGKPHEINMILVLFCSPSLLFCVDENILWEKSSLEITVLGRKKSSEFRFY